jgi:site-specific DNA-methyltransferase (adenine-specific)
MAKVLPQEYELVPAADLRLHPENPNQGDVGAIAESIEENGFYGALLVQRSTGYVIAGNHRVKAVVAQGLGKVPVIWVDIDDDRARRILLADNKTAQMATYDEEMLGALLKDLAVSEAGLAGTGWEGDELDRLLARSAVELGDDDVPDVPDAPVTRPGDVWLLGEHRLVCGDAADPTAVAAACGGEPAELLWTDPPYGVEYVGKTADALTIKGDNADGLADLLAASFSAAGQSLKPGSPVYVAHPAGSLSLVFLERFLGAGWRLHQTLVWVKDTMVLGHADYHYRHEPILYGYTPGGYGRRGRGGDGWWGGNDRTSVLEYPKPSASREHPTAKPVDLVAHCLQNSSATGTLVLDPFGGSGTTLVAAHRLGRRAALVELDPGYCDVVCARWEALTGEAPRRAGEDEAAA